MKSLNGVWIIGASINLTLFYINIVEGDYLYATLSLLCAVVFILNLK